MDAKKPAWRATALALLVAASLLVVVPRAEAAAPGAATQSSPSGTATNPVTYKWAHVMGSTYYYLWVQNTGTNETIVKKWYTASNGGCGTGTCTISNPATLSPGSYRWWVQTWNSDGYGPWSSGLSFNVPFPPGKPSITGPHPGEVMYYEFVVWTRVATATYYQVWINKTGTSTNVWSKWHSDENFLCGSTYCDADYVLPAGNYTAWVRAWSPAGNGPWSDGVSFTVHVPPATAPISPSGSGNASQPTYEWQYVDPATWYYLWVSRDGTPVIKHWYKADDLVESDYCHFEAPTCRVTPSTALQSGSYTWWVQTWSPAGYGPWSAGMNFSVG